MTNNISHQQFCLNMRQII